MTRERTKDGRRSARVSVAKGVWVAWQQPKGPRNVSRVGDVSAGGVFISTLAAVPVGAQIEMLFALPEGETRVTGIVRYVNPEKGIGVEFTNMGTGDRARLQELLRRLNR